MATTDDIDMESKPSGSFVRKGVVFRDDDSVDQIRRISRISNYSLEEVIAYWGNSEEQNERKQEIRQAALDFAMGRRMSDNMEFTSKGIADKVGEGRALKKQNRKLSRMAVMDEQGLQDSEGLRDDELLAEIYMGTTRAAKARAHQEALEMAEEVERLNLQNNE